MFKKITLAIISMTLLLGATFAYTLNSSDKILVQKLTQKVETVIESKGETLRSKFIKVLNTYAVKYKSEKPRYAEIFLWVAENLENQDIENKFESILSETNEPKSNIVTFKTPHSTFEIWISDVPYEQVNDYNIAFKNIYECEEESVCHKASHRINISEKRYLEEVRSQIHEESPTVIVKPNIKEINGYQVLERSEGWYGYSVYSVVFWENANYKFEATEVNEGEEQETFDYFESVIETIKEL